MFLLLSYQSWFAIIPLNFAQHSICIHENISLFIEYVFATLLLMKVLSFVETYLMQDKKVSIQELNLISETLLFF